MRDVVIESVEVGETPKEGFAVLRVPWGGPIPRGDSLLDTNRRRVARVIGDPEPVAANGNDDLRLRYKLLYTGRPIEVGDTLTVR